METHNSGQGTRPEEAGAVRCPADCCDLGTRCRRPPLPPPPPPPMPPLMPPPMLHLLPRTASTTAAGRWWCTCCGVWPSTSSTVCGAPSSTSCPPDRRRRRIVSAVSVRFFLSFGSHLRSPLPPPTSVPFGVKLKIIYPTKINQPPLRPAYFCSFSSSSVS